MHTNGCANTLKYAHTHFGAIKERQRGKRGRGGCIQEKIQFSCLIDQCAVIFLISDQRKKYSLRAFLHNREYFLATTALTHNLSRARGRDT